ncbi:MAG TPA: Hsp20/alpha crystallin family protein [Chitinophagaceae bacterium]|nr:Hsp20/alpha crystallin family protein [Chitinophagaceae bacterium]
MNITAASSEPSAVYPGVYTAMPVSTMRRKRARKRTLPALRTGSLSKKMLGNCLQLEMLIPGCKREEIFIDGHRNFLSVCVPQSLASADYRPIEQTQTTNYFQQLISLPQKADGAFANATYQNGMLTILVPMGAMPLAQQKPYRIAVY